VTCFIGTLLSSPTILTLVRHGETPANTGGVWHGSTDSPLTERGREQATLVAAYVRQNFSDARAVYASHLRRARETAQAIADVLGHEVRVDVDLGEFDLGTWEGKTFRELHDRHKLWDRMRDDPHYAPHGGESPRQVVDRLVAALRRVAAAHPGERVIVVSHGGALSMVLGELLDGDYSSWRRVLRNCAISELVLDPAPELLSFDVVDHLGAE
jgi:broad specificity phosphatase PhoE